MEGILQLLGLSRDTPTSHVMSMHQAQVCRDLSCSCKRMMITQVQEFIRIRTSVSLRLEIRTEYLDSGGDCQVSLSMDRVLNSNCFLHSVPWLILVGLIELRKLSDLGLTISTHDLD